METMESGPSLHSPTHSISLLSMDGCLTQSQHSIATNTSGKKKKGSSDKRTKLSKSKQTGISHAGAGGRQKINKSCGSGKIKSKSPVKSNYKSFESLASCRDRLGSENEDADEEFVISAKNDAKDDWNVSDLVQDSTEDLSDDESCYPALTKATLIDQDSGEVYQFIENKRGTGGQRETFLMQQPQGSPHVSHTLARVPDRHVSSGGWGSSVSRTLSRAPSRGEALSEFCSDLQLLIPDRGEAGGPGGNVERFIAVPVSPSYLTDHLRSLTHAVTASPGHSAAPALVRAPDAFITGAGDRDLNQVLPPGPPPVTMCTSLVSAQVHAVASDAKPPPPTCERLSPIGANSRATSKLSLDNILDTADQTTVF